MPSDSQQVDVVLGREVEHARLAMRRTSRLSAALGPTGTLSCGRFGTRSSTSRRRVSMSSSSASSRLICSARCLFASSRPVASPPWRLSLAISSPGLVPLLLQRFDDRDALSPIALERGQLFQQWLEAGAARQQAGLHFVETVANECGVEHGVTYSRRLRWRRERSGPCPTRVRKAVFPAAGLGTRFLPATKAQPKEMLPLVDKPIIQYGVEEAAASGVEHIIIVTGRGKNAIEDHFDINVELETFLEARGKSAQAQEIRAISDAIQVAYVRQGEPLGLGHAVLCARDLVGDEPFAVILADDVYDADPAGAAAVDRRVRTIRRPRRLPSNASRGIASAATA